MEATKLLISEILTQVQILFQEPKLATSNPENIRKN